jgi:hypothetical protein
VCDQALAGGQRIVMLAESHLHKHISEGGEEFWPGEFRRNYIYCPEHTELGLFRGMRSGASYFVLGGIAEEVEFTASAGGETIMMGESLVVPSGQPIEVCVSFTENIPHDGIELIGNPHGQVRVVAEAQGSDLAHSVGRATWRTEVTMGSRSFYLRGRGSAHISRPYPVKAWFYTNPLWLTPEELERE